jgi:hypothetical protein
MSNNEIQDCFDPWEEWENSEERKMEYEKEAREIAENDEWLFECAFWTDLEDDPKQIATMPKECKTYEVCLFVMERDGNLLEFVPEEFKSEEMCRAALVSSNCSKKILRFFPQTMEKKTKISIYFDVIRERIKRIEYRALRSLAIRELQKDAPRWRGITEEEIEAKIAELRTKVEQDYKELPAHQNWIRNSKTLKFNS